MAILCFIKPGNGLMKASLLYYYLHTDNYFLEAISTVFSCSLVGWVKLEHEYWNVVTSKEFFLIFLRYFRGKTVGVIKP
jgi:hypothetical protein